MWFFQEDTLEYLNYEPFAFNPKKIDFVILTHAHLDHSALIPKLFGEGFKGKVITTTSTKDLLEIMLLDALKVQKNEHYKEPLYDEENIYKALKSTEVLKYNQVLNLKGINLTFYDAGHILGSASVKLEIDGKSIVFSGDIGRKIILF